MADITYSGPPSTEDYIRFYSQAGNRRDQINAILNDRRQADRLSAETGQPRDLNLRNAEHFMLVQHEMGESPWHRAMAYPILTPAIPIYSAMKWLAQKLPTSSLVPKQDSTPPSLEEVKWGLAPLYSRGPEQQIDDPVGNLARAMMNLKPYR